MAEPIVAVDGMSGNHAPAALVEGAVAAWEAGVRVVLVGTPAIRELIPAGVPMGWVCAEAPNVGSPSALRRQPEASVRRAMRLVTEGAADAVVSCGASGLTLVGAVLELGLIEGLDRPAIGAPLPRADGGTLVLVDAGASVDVRPEHLVQHAILGSAWARVLGAGDEPRVGVLSNGVEAGKGNRLVQQVVEVLARLPLGSVGQVEPHTALAGGADVVVCDGFVGNIMLKTAEGVVEMLRAVFDRALASDGAAREALPALGSVFGQVGRRVDWRAHGGALLLGVRAPVVVGHGRSDAASVCAAIRQADYAVRAGLVPDLCGRLPALLSTAAPWLAGQV